MRTAHDQCEFVKQFCQDEDDGRIHYLELYYCTLGSAKVAVWFIIIPWTAFLFMFVGITAGDFFAVNLSSIARTLRLSDTLAGVTLLALGNGGPDIFSTWAAMTSNSPELAIGELVGAASFITLVIAGSLPFCTTFKVRKESLIRDASFMFITACLLLPALIMKELHFWQGVLMIVVYLIYVIFVMGYHWWISRKKQTANHTVSNADEEEGEITPTETRPLLDDHHRQQRQQHRTHAQAHVDPKYGHMPAALYRDLGEWRHAHGRCITANDDYIVQPSLMGSCEYRWRRQHKFKHHHIAPPESSNTHNETHQPPSPRHDLEDDRVFYTLFPAFRNLRQKNWFHVITNLVTSIPYFILKIIIPVVDNEHDDNCNHGWARWLLLVQGILAPQFVWALLWVDSDQKMTLESWAVPAAWCLMGSVIFTLAVAIFSSSKYEPRWYPFLSLIGFCLSAFCLSTIADEVVAILKAIGMIFGISEAILGFTIFAIGNSIDDWVANVTVSQHGHPVMALSACFGGPLLNILLGLGTSATYVLGKKAQQSGKFTTITWNADPVLIVSTAALAATMLVLVFSLRLNHWQMAKKIGIGLIATWVGVTIANLVIELV